MRRLFDEQPIDFGSTISMEAGSMIHVQKLDDPWRVKGLDLMTRMRDYLVDNGTENNKKFFYSPEGMAFYKELADLIEERFGIKTRICLEEAPNAYMGCMHLPGLHAFDKELTWNEIPSNYLALWIKYLTDSDIRKFAKDYEKFKEQAKKYNITIDLKNARIKGLPKDAGFITGFNAPGMFNTIGLTPEEALGVVTHEVGHAFTHLSVAYRDIINTTVLLNNFIENIEQKNRSSKDSLIFAYSAVTKADVNKLKTIKKSEEVGVAVLQEAIELNYSGYASIDSEQQADQFAGRFGLGADCVAGVEKMGLGVNTYAGWFMTKHIFILELIRCVLYGAGPGFAMNMLCLPLTFLYASAYYPFTVLMGKFFDQPVLSTNTYDTDKFRQTRAYHELVRQIKIAEDPMVKDFLLEKLQIIDSLPSYHLPNLFSSGLKYPVPFYLTYIFPVLGAFRLPFSALASTAYQIFIPGVRRKVKMRDIERLVEALDASQLHVAGAKIDQYLRKNK